MGFWQRLFGKAQAVPPQKLTRQSDLQCREAVSVPPNRDDPSVPDMQPSQTSPDQEALAQIAIQDPDWMASSNAAEQLTDQTLIAKVARTARDNTARIAAVLKLEDTEVLATIAKSDEDSVVRKAAAGMFARRTPAGEDELKRIRSASGQRQGILLRCGGCGSQELARLEVVLDKNNNRGILCESCIREYLPLLRAGSDRRFWQCAQCTFRILAGTRIDAAVNPESKCPHCGADVNVSLVNLNNDRPVASGMIGEPLE